MIAPSYSVLPDSFVIVNGEKAFQMIFSQMLTAMKSEITLPIPYHLCKVSSRRRTMIPATTN